MQLLGWLGTALLLGLAANSLQEETLKGSRSEQELPCKNVTLVILLERRGTKLRLESSSNDPLLNLSYSPPKPNEIGVLLMFIVSLFFPEDRNGIRMRNISRHIKVSLKEMDEREVIEVQFNVFGIVLTTDVEEPVLVKHGTSRSVCGSLTSVKLEVAGDLDPNALDHYNMTALHWAAFIGDLRLGEQLLRRGADVNRTGLRGGTPLHFAGGAGHAEFARLLLDRGAAVDAVASGTPLLLAARLGRTSVVRLLAGRGADIEYRSRPDGYTPLLEAAQGGHLATVTELLNLGASVNATDSGGANALHKAAENGHVGVASLLFSTGGLGVNSRDDRGRTPLMYAAEMSYTYGSKTDVVKLLLTNGADVNAKDRFGSTALSLARHSDDIEQLLLASGAKRH